MHEISDHQVFDFSCRNHSPKDLLIASEYNKIASSQSILKWWSVYTAHWPHWSKTKKVSQLNSKPDLRAHQGKPLREALTDRTTAWIKHKYLYNRKRKSENYTMQSGASIRKLKSHEITELQAMTPLKNRGVESGNSSYLTLHEPVRSSSPNKRFRT